MRVLLLLRSDPGGYYGASLLMRGHSIVQHGGGGPLFHDPDKFVAARQDYLRDCDACLLIGDHPELLEIADHFADTGKPVWHNLADVPRKPEKA